MKRRWRLLLVLFFLFVLAGLLLVPSVRWPVYGWLRSEAFYQRMPASWWRNDIEENYQTAVAPELFSAPAVWLRVNRDSSLGDTIRQRFGPAKAAIPVSDMTFNVPLLNGDPDATPLLLALLRDESAKVRRVAIVGLANQKQSNPDIVALLEEAFQDPDPDVRREAGIALMTLHVREIFKDRGHGKRMSAPPS